MFHHQLPAMQGDSIRKRTPAAILSIAKDGHTRMRELDPDLMLATCQRPYFE
jgi:hypothetical protein